MKKSAWFFLILLTLYFGAMYQSLPLMVMVSAELLFSVCMWMLSRYFIQHIFVDIPERGIAGERESEIGCFYRMIYDGKLPVSRFRIRMWMFYSHGQYAQQKQRGSGIGKLRGRVSGLRERSVKYVYGAAETGVNRLYLGICPPYCGIICLKFDKVRVYDYLALFSAGKPLSQEIQIAVLPPGQPLRMELPFGKSSENFEGQDDIIWQNGNTQDEIRQLHEYRAGDFYRYIHWNLSARTDKMWVKEYEKEMDICVEVLLGLDGMHRADQAGMDAFYRLLSAIVLGLLQTADIVKVHWYDADQKKLVGTDVRDGGQCEKLLLELYRLDCREPVQVQEKELLEAYASTCSNFITLDLQLHWYFNGNLIYCFSQEKLAQEIAEKIFIL